MIYEATDTGNIETRVYAAEEAVVRRTKIKP
jgi:hypothetical protein